MSPREIKCLPKPQRFKRVEITMSVPGPPEPRHFADIARLIGGDEAPMWLMVLLCRFSSSLHLNTRVDDSAPFKREVKARLEAMDQAACTISSGLLDNTTVDFLQAAGVAQIENLNRFRHDLDLLASIARQAARSPDISTADGKAKPGRGRARREDGFSSHVYCAALIAEAWRYVRGGYPPARNEQAEAAAATYWERTGGARRGHSDDARESWRRHLRTAVADGGPASLEEFRSTVRLHLAETSRGHRVA